MSIDAILDFVGGILEIALNKEDYIGYHLKKITKSSSIALNKKSHGYHIEITGDDQAMLLFPLVSSSAYNGNPHEKRRYYLKLGIRIYRNNLLKLARRIVTDQPEDLHDDLKNYQDWISTHSSIEDVLLTSSASCTYQIRGTGQKQFEIGKADDDDNFIFLRKCLLPDDYLLFIQRGPAEYDVVGLASSDMRGHIFSEFEVLDLNRNRVLEPKYIAEESIDSLSREAQYKDIVKNFYEDINGCDLQYNQYLVTRYIASLLTKSLVIFTGLAGSGKTKLALSFAQWICDNELQYKLIPVGADWTNREPLLGYPNALDKDKYVKPDNGVIDLLIEASKEENCNKPYFLILDEMNLSHVERYFADFLSALESKESLYLHSDTLPINDIPSKITIPNNLFIIGTVNIDETTYMFSPKVLDRASVIEFRVSESEMTIFLQNPRKPNIDLINGLGRHMGNAFVGLSQTAIFDFTETADLNTVLFDFFKELKKTGAEFGYRTASDIYRFAELLKSLTKNDPWSIDDIADSAIVQKLLPKLHGSRRKLEPVLKKLSLLCLTAGQDGVLLSKPEEIKYTDRAKIRFPVTLEKIMRMQKRVQLDGFTSFAEA